MENKLEPLSLMNNSLRIQNIRRRYKAKLVNTNFSDIPFSINIIPPIFPRPIQLETGLREALVS